MATKEVLTFIGQGVTVAEALSDGVKALGTSYRRTEGKCAVRLADGTPVLRTLKEFEAAPPPSIEDVGELFG